MTFIYRFVRSIPYRSSRLFRRLCQDLRLVDLLWWSRFRLRFRVQPARLAVCWASDQHQVPAQVLLSSLCYLGVVGSSRSRSRVVVWFPFLPSLSLSRSARSSCCVLGVRSAPSASAGASFYPSSLDVVSSSRSRPRVFRSGSRLRLRFRVQRARLCVCSAPDQHQVPTQVLLSPPCSLDLVPGSRSGSRFCLRLRSQLGTARSSAGRRQLQGNRRHRVPTCQGHVQ
jgi:hypothetical protein